jgi:hypothetical protein
VIPIFKATLHDWLSPFNFPERNTQFGSLPTFQMNETETDNSKMPFTPAGKASGNQTI